MADTESKARATPRAPTGRDEALALAAGRRWIRFPDHYAWYILVSSLDIMLTDLVLREFGAEEVNTIANWMLQRLGVVGLVLLKVATIAVVVVICDLVARRSVQQGRRLAEWAIALSAVPVVVSLFQLALVGTGWLPPPDEQNVRQTEIFVPTIRPRRPAVEDQPAEPMPPAEDGTIPPVP